MKRLEITPEEENPKVTCYSDGERGWMAKSQELRARCLNPFMAILARCGVTPNGLTLLSLACGLAFCPVFIWSSRVAAFALLLLHVILDGLDGPLARYLKIASNRGSMTDTASDQVVVAFSTVTLIHTGFAGVWPGALYIFFYTVVVILAMVRNAMEIPYSWLVRPRFLVFAWTPVEVYLWRGTLDWLLWFVVLLLALKMLTGFIHVRRRL